MNKQELIDKWESKTGAPSYEISDFPINPSKNEMYIAGYGVARTEILKDLKQLDEPQKPVVPCSVGSLIEFYREKGVTLIHILNCFKEWTDTDNEHSDEVNWIVSNSETFMRAWLYGYEVEKEPMYRVKLGDGYFVGYQGRGVLTIPDGNKEIKIFDSKSDAERIAHTIGGTVEEEAEG
ncbi:DUF1642 domain-containing protein [Enterococcus sp. HMSC34G12]|uniref:DUF1642 domain-containing protein n=1 Tax=Enterococcus sp. HMSC34G12 TaxID=1608861 RepID=UPI0008A8A4F8|nr:DUF1642 domain-containing protein [Enterococcus sp. HMSC34G12]OHR71717.1 hypothetical protein HMPREF3242_07035 [Enterococcus sp. HMSC34G12]